MSALDNDEDQRHASSDNDEDNYVPDLSEDKFRVLETVEPAYQSVLQVLRRTSSLPCSPFFEAVVRPSLSHILHISWRMMEESSEVRKETWDVIHALATAFVALDLQTDGNLTTEFSSTLN